MRNKDFETRGCRLISLVLAVALAAALVARGEEETEKSLAREAVERLSLTAFADVETAYWARGKIVDRNPFSAQFVGLEYDLGPFGRLIGNVWSASAMSRNGQSSNRQNFYNELDYVAFYGYAYEFAEGWTLDTFGGPKWVALPGYHPHAATVYEWNLGQSLKNPYVTPYYLMRRAYYKSDWCYWDVGLMRSWALLENLTLTVKAFGELGNTHLFRSQYGPNPHGGGYTNGLMALNLTGRLDYAVTEWFGLFLFVHQFAVVSGDARDALDSNPSPESVKDLTIGGVGFTLNF